MTAASAEDLRPVMRDFVGVTDARAPLYARLAELIAQRPQILAILAEAPEAQRIPVTLFAAIHDLLLADPGEALAAWYPNLRQHPRQDDPSDALDEFCARKAEALTALVRTRMPQTNEIGRSSLLLMGLSEVAQECGELAQLDLGASAGLNLLIDRISYDFSGWRVGEGPIALACGVRGDGRGRLPSQVPVIASRQGIDLAPIDLRDPDQVRWLQACVWPDQTDRFERLAAAISEAVRLAPPVTAGDLLNDLADAVDRLGPGHPVLTSSWVLNYLGVDGQQRLLANLDQLGRDRDLSLVSYESPELTPGLGWPDDLAAESLSVLRVWRWRRGRRSDRVLAKGHPHGYWFSWLS